MKLNKNLLLALCIVCLGSSTAVYLYGWNPFSADSWKDLGNKINDAVIKPTGDALKDAGNKINDKVVNPAGDAFKKAGDKIKDYSTIGWDQTKKAAQKFNGYMETAADETSNFAQMVYKEGLKPTGDAIKQYGDIGATMVKNWFKTRPHHDYCDISKSTFTDPALITSDEAKKADTESLIPYIEKYAPVAWIQGAEDYYPMRFSEYITGPGTSIVSRTTNQTIVPKGQVTFAKIYDMHKNSKQYDDQDLAFDVADCTLFGADPAKNQDSSGNLTTPIYVITFDSGDKTYIQYMFFYGLNGPFDVGPFKGNVLEIQDYHEADLEHFTVELDKNTKEITRFYYSSHGTREGFWLDAKDPDVEYEGTHPVVYIAHYSHAVYPKDGTYVRIYGLANDVTGKGQKWIPQVMRIYKEDDKRFDKDSMSFMYFPGSYGRHGVAPVANQGWFTNVGGDIGRPYTPKKWFCENMPHRDTTSSNPVKAISEAAKALADGIKYAECIAVAIPQTKIPE